MKLSHVGAGKYRLDFILCGVRFQKTFGSKVEAHRFIYEYEKNHISKLTPLPIARDEFLKISKKLKSNTSYLIEKKALMVLCESLCMTGEDFFVSEIRPQDIEALRNNLITRGLKNTSVNRSLAVYKHFFNKCKQWGYVHTNPCQFIKKLPDNHKPRDSWLMEDLEVVSQHFKTHYYEDYLIFEFLRHTGCRLSTATRLRVRDVDLERKIVRLSTRKGAHSQERFYEVPISPRLGEVLKKCVKNKRLNDFVFLWRGQEVNCNNYSKRFKKRLRKLPLKGTCLILHALRNSFATRLSSKGVPINDIRRLLGHTNTIVTQMYLSENVEDLKKYVS